MSKSKTPKQEEKNIVAVEQALSRSEQFIERNQKIIIWVVGIIVLLVAGYILATRFVLAPREKEASAEMFMAELHFERDSLQLALNGDGVYPGFLDIISEYRFTSAANLSNYYAGIIYMRLGEYELALEHLKRFNGRDKLVGAMALGAIGDAYIELGQLDRGLRFYRRAYSHEPNDLTTPLFLFKAGLTKEVMGEPAEALKYYERIKEEFPNTAEGRNIDRYIGRVSVQ